MHPSDASDHPGSTDGVQSGAGEPDPAAEAPDEPGDEASAADVFEHLARIRSGISDGVITPW